MRNCFGSYMPRLFCFALVAIVACGLLAVVMPAYAYDPLSPACTGQGGQSATCKELTSTNPLTGNDGVIYKITLMVATAAGIAAVITIIVSGYRYVTSSGDPQKTSSARTTFVGAIVGLVIIVLAQSVVMYVVRRL